MPAQSASPSPLAAALASNTSMGQGFMPANVSGQQTPFYPGYNPQQLHPGLQQQQNPYYNKPGMNPNQQQMQYHMWQQQQMKQQQAMMQQGQQNLDLQQQQQQQPPPYSLLNQQQSEITPKKVFVILDRDFNCI